MTKKQYLKKMSQHKDSFDKLWQKIVDDTNAYIESGGSGLDYQVDYFADDLAFSCGWINDRLNGISGSTCSNTYKKSLTRKIRKVLGYNI